jgi:hypothetical protein
MPGPTAATSDSVDAFPRRAVAVCTALGAFFLGTFWWRNGTFLDSDEATVGLMARHILQGEWPIFYWGQEYLGAVEAYLAAPLFLLLGSSVQALKLVPVLFTIATIPIAADVLYIAAGRRAAIAGALVFAFPPLAFSLWSIKTRGGFTEPAELGFWLFWMALRLVQSTEHRGRWAAGFGLTLGVTLWWSYFVVPYALVGVLVLALHPRGRSLWIAGLIAALSIVGALPALWRNAFTTHWSTVIHALHPDPSQRSAGQPDHAVPAEAWERLKHIGLPSMMGFHDARVEFFRWGSDPDSFAGAYFLFLLGLGLAIAALLTVKRGRPREARLAAAGAPLGAVLMTLLYVFSRFGFEPEPRYVLAMWLGVGCCYALAISNLASLHVAVAAVAATLLCGFQTWRTYFVETPSQVVQWRKDAPAVESFAALVEHLKVRGVQHLQADYWTAERLTFESRESVIAADLRTSRNESAKRIVASDPKACWLSTPGNQADGMVRSRGWTRTVFGRDVPGLGMDLILACPP